jgi:phosphatidate phosphatase APP1
MIYSFEFSVILREENNFNLEDPQLFDILESEVTKLRKENEELKISVNKNKNLTISDLEDTIKELSLIILNSVNLITRNHWKS